MNTRKIETSDPSEINEEFLVAEVLRDSADVSSGGETPESGARTPIGAGEGQRFAKPRGPARRRP